MDSNNGFDCLEYSLLVEHSVVVANAAQLHARLLFYLA